MCIIFVNLTEVIFQATCGILIGLKIKIKTEKFKNLNNFYDLICGLFQ